VLASSHALTLSWKTSPTGSNSPPCGDNLGKARLGDLGERAPSPSPKLISLVLTSLVGRAQRDRTPAPLRDSLQIGAHPLVRRLHVWDCAGVLVGSGFTSVQATEPNGSALRVDFAILTALEIEREAVCAAFGFTERTRTRCDSRVYWAGKLKLRKGDFYGIVVAQASDMANIDMAILTNDTLHRWKPGAALLVGIAGSAKPEVRVGDILVASEIYYY
jgi:hypothetical protein